MKSKKHMIRAIPAFVLAVCLLLALGGTALASAEPAASGELLDTSELFTDRDLKQTADLEDAETLTVITGSDIQITAAGVYVLTGSATDVTVYVEAAAEDKVQLVLDGVSITNKHFPCIHVKSADKVFITTSADSSLSVTGEFTAEGGATSDGVIFSRTDTVLNGTALLSVSSSDNGVVCKDELKVTGGSYKITAESKCLEANDAILIADGVFTLTAGTDGLQAENDDDDALGFVYIQGGEFTIDAGKEGIQALSVVQIDGGSFDISAGDAIEATYIQINGGTVAIAAEDHGLNGVSESASYASTVEVNAGTVTIVTEGDDEDGVNCDGDILINGGSVTVNGAAVK